MRKLEDVEKQLVLQAIVDKGFDLEAAGDSLGITKRTVYRMLSRWKLPTPTGGRPETTLWSEHQKRCGKILKALETLQSKQTGDSL